MRGKIGRLMRRDRRHVHVSSGGVVMHCVVGVRASMRPCVRASVRPCVNASLRPTLTTSPLGFNGIYLSITYPCSTLIITTRRACNSVHNKQHKQ